MAPRLASISVDLDPLRHYCRIHGLSESLLSPEAQEAVYALAVPRLLELFSAARVDATLFAIGEDVEDAPLAQEALRKAHRMGHEIGSHSHAHDYALSRWAPADIHADLSRAQAVLGAAVGEAPVGFRAPGYTLTPALYRALEIQGFRYASSVFPAAPYWAAKAAVMGALAVLGRPSKAILDSPRVLAAPLEPYRPDPAQPYRRGAGQVLELPVTVTPLGRFPVIGTFVATLPEAVTRSLVSLCRDVPHFNFELHAVDVLDASDGVPPELAAQQRDLGVPWTLKAERLLALFRRVARERDAIPLRDAADAFPMV